MENFLEQIFATPGLLLNVLYNFFFDKRNPEFIIASRLCDLLNPDENRFNATDWWNQ